MGVTNCQKIVRFWPTLYKDIGYKRFQHHLSNVPCNETAAQRRRQGRRLGAPQLRTRVHATATAR